MSTLEGRIRFIAPILFIAAMIGTSMFLFIRNKTGDSENATVLLGMTVIALVIRMFGRILDE